MRRWIILTSLCLLAGNSAANAAIIRGPGAPGTGTPPTAEVTTDSVISDFNGNFANQAATSAISLGAGQDFLRITFWGRYEAFPTTKPTDDFTLRVWGPGIEPGLNNDAIYNASVSTSSTVYGTQTNATPSPTLYEYSIDLTASPIQVTQSGDYFLSIVNNIPDPNNWEWYLFDDTGLRYTRGGDASWLESNGALAFQSEHAPEPGSLAVLGLGALGMGLVAWRRRKKGKQQAC